ncbi:hypothetical protein GCM10023347_09790 [Streptomyces chumphonensis]|uniref:Integral membrane protein n=1 Tax=Streptomyces chumphonensis TaxID=1214925 RepID=A0A927F1S2_9ACTN|nr:hypothetical protein [Streptomyces chumphonensis]MBD3934015.1 hypothetical protein [Streptomyces chumphonensis]
MARPPAPPTLRAGVFSAVCVLPAAVGHVLMSHSLPLWAPITAFLVTAALSLAPARRERGPLAVIGSSVLVQTLLHMAFSLVQALTGPAMPHPAGHTGSEGHAAPGGPGGPHGHPTLGGHGGCGDGMAGATVPAAPAHPGMTAGQDVPGLDPWSLLTHGSAGMTAAHLLAATITGWWLWRGETAAFRIGRALVAALFEPLLSPPCRARVPFPELRAVPGGTEDAVPREERHLRHALSRRGPPPRPAAVVDVDGTPPAPPRTGPVLAVG